MSTISDAPALQGFVAPGFEPVAEAFAQNFTALDERGAAFAVVKDGAVLVDIKGGSAAPGRPWTDDTLMPVFSGTKGLVGTMMLMLVDRGQLDLDRRVADYWPKFAAGGKGGVLVRDIVSHHSGVPGITLERLKPGDLTDAEAMEARVAAEPLSTDPRAFAAYHALTVGWLCGGVLRRIDGRSIGRFFAEEVAGPLGLDVFIGLPEALEPRVGTLEFAADWNAWDGGLTPEQAADPLRRSIENPPLFQPGNLYWNGAAFHAAEIAGAGAVASALGMARHYACLASGGATGDVRLMRPETLAAGRRELNRFDDPFIGVPMSFATCYALQTAQRGLGPVADAFGHGGAGGSIHGAWPTEGIGFSYVMNHMRQDPEQRRTKGLLEALAAVLNA